MAEKKLKTPIERLEYMRSYYKTDKYRAWQRDYRKRTQEKQKEYERRRYLKNKKKGKVKK